MFAERDDRQSARSVQVYDKKEISLKNLSLIATYFIIVSGLLVLKDTANAQSFNCRYAKTSDEVLICQEPELSKLDEQMADKYFSLRNILDRSDQALLARQQANWIRGRMSCGRDSDCIASSYRRRIRALVEEIENE
jgi:uncharacterized protein